MEAVERGEGFVIARAGQPVAMLSAYHPPRRKIAPPGSMEGQSWWMADDFDEAIDDLFDCLGEDTGPDNGVQHQGGNRQIAR